MTQPAADMAGLHDIVAQEAVGWWPLAPGWWAVLVALLLLAGWRAWASYRSWRAAGYRRAALEELRVIESDLGDPAGVVGAVPRVASLIKRTALCTAPRESVAPLSGEAWLRYLDRGARFTEGAGRRLPQLTYGPGGREVSPDQAREIVSLARRWIREHPAS